MMAKGSSRSTRLLAATFLGVAVWLGTTAMHIPDGYLSPSTSLVLFVLVLPFWAIGIRRVRQQMDARTVPLIALAAAFSFVVMLFNVPLPGGTTGHAVGATLAAIVLGPEIAVIAVSIALIIQALFFGDGGILAIGANCFNMAVVIPYASYALYTVIARDAPRAAPLRLAAAAIAGWAGVSLGAFMAGVEFGLQPLLFKSPQGAPLYAPYPLSIAIPAMVIPHMLVAGVVEGLLTALVLAYLLRARIGVPEAGPEGAAPAGPAPRSRLRWAWVGLAILIAASPLGLLAPGTAWGEWTSAQLGRMGLGSVPAGLQRLSTLWGAPLAGYRVPALGNTSLGYLISAALGMAVVVIVAWLFGMLATGSSRPRRPE